MFDFLFFLAAALLMALSTAPLVWKRTRERYDGVTLRNGRCGREIAEGLLRHRKVALPVVEHDAATAPGSSPAAALRLPPQIFHGRSVFAAGLAAYEVERVLRHHPATAPLRFQQAVERYRFGGRMWRRLERPLSFVSRASNFWSGMCAALRAGDLVHQVDFVEPEERAGIAWVARAAAMTYANDFSRIASRAALTVAAVAAAIFVGLFIALILAVILAGLSGFVGSSD